MPLRLVREEAYPWEVMRDEGEAEVGQMRPLKKDESTKI